MEFDVVRYQVPAESEVVLVLHTLGSALVPHSKTLTEDVLAAVGLK
jgi:hypothetical protein